jgi:hypothetical protein
MNGGLIGGHRIDIKQSVDFEGLLTDSRKTINPAFTGIEGGNNKADTFWGFRRNGNTLNHSLDEFLCLDIVPTI